MDSGRFTRCYRQTLLTLPRSHTPAVSHSSHMSHSMPLHLCGLRTSSWYTPCLQRTKHCDELRWYDYQGCVTRHGAQEYPSINQIPPDPRHLAVCPCSLSAQREQLFFLKQSNENSCPDVSIPQGECLLNPWILYFPDWFSPPKSSESRVLRALFSKL